MKQTAVDWLSEIDKVRAITIEEWQQAKEMEKEHRETYRYTEEDLRKAFNAGLMNRYSRTGEAVAEEEFIQSLNQLK